jgi:hypothetical protein
MGGSAGLRPFTWPAMVLTALGGLAILILARRRECCPVTVRASRVVDLAGVDNHPGRSATLLAWLALGLWLARGSR